MAEQDDSREGVSTGERLFTQHPEVYQSVVAMLGQGAGIREIKRRLGVHHRTIQAVAIREGQTIDTMRRELGARALGVAGLAMESLEERIISGGVKPAELSMAIGILVDKGQLLTGGVTGRVEKIERHQVEKEIDGFLSEVETIKPGDTGFRGENVLPMDADLVGPGSAAPAGLLADACIDSESTASGLDSMVSNAIATGSATGGPAAEASAGDQVPGSCGDRSRMIEGGPGPRPAGSDAGEVGRGGSHETRGGLDTIPIGDPENFGH